MNYKLFKDQRMGLNPLVRINGKYDIMSKALSDLFTEDKLFSGKKPINIYNILESNI